MSKFDIDGNLPLQGGIIELNLSAKYFVFSLQLDEKQTKLRLSIFIFVKYKIEVGNKLCGRTASRKKYANDLKIRSERKTFYKNTHIMTLGEKLQNI